MGRKLFTFAAAMSAVAFVAACVLWVGSHHGMFRPLSVRPRWEFVSTRPQLAGAGPDNRGQRTYRYSDWLLSSYRGYVGIGGIEGREELPPRGPCVSANDRDFAAAWLWHEARPPALAGPRGVSL